MNKKISVAQYRFAIIGSINVFVLIGIIYWYYAIKYFYASGHTFLANLYLFNTVVLPLGIMIPGGALALTLMAFVGFWKLRGYTD